MIQALLGFVQAEGLAIGWRYTRAEMGAVWSDERRMRGWLDVELAATDALAGAGKVPADAAAACRELVPRSPSRRWRNASGRPATTSRRSSTWSRPRSATKAALDPLRPHLLGRSRHRAGHSGWSRPRGHPDRRRDHLPADVLVARAKAQPKTPCIGRTRRARGADDLRAPARRLRVRGGSQPRAPAGGVRAGGGRQAPAPSAPTPRCRRRSRPPSCLDAPGRRTSRPRSCPGPPRAGARRGGASRRRARALRAGGPQPPADRGPRGRGAVRVRGAKGSSAMPTSAT